MKKSVKYVFRSLPCNITTDDKLWYVGGNFGGGGGVLEWCYDKEDAERVMERMKKDSRFSNLHVNKYQQ